MRQGQGLAGIAHQIVRMISTVEVSGKEGLPGAGKDNTPRGSALVSTLIIGAVSRSGGQGFRGKDVLRAGGFPESEYR